MRVYLENRDFTLLAIKTNEKELRDVQTESTLKNKDAEFNFRLEKMFSALQPFLDESRYEHLGTTTEPTNPLSFSSVKTISNHKFNFLAELRNTSLVENYELQEVVKENYERPVSHLMKIANNDNILVMRPKQTAIRENLDRINAALIGTHIGRGNFLSIEDLKVMQQKDEFIEKFKDKVRVDPNTEYFNYKFELHQEVLYMSKPFKTDLILRLVIPPTLARRYLFSLHFSKSLHVSSTQLLGIFNQIFFCFQQTALAKKITDDCLICSFYKFPYRKDTKGSSKFQHENYRPWTHLSMDIAVLIPDRYKKRFAIILVDEASSYTMLFSLKDTLSCLLYTSPSPRD